MTSTKIRKRQSTWLTPLDKLRRPSHIRPGHSANSAIPLNNLDDTNYIVLSECEDPVEPKISELPLNEAVSVFCQNTTSHGFNHLFYLKKRSAASQISFILVLFGCILGSFFAIFRTTSTTLFSNNPGTVVKYRIADFSVGLPLPDFIVCSNSFFRKSRVTAENLTSDFVSLIALSIGGPEVLGVTTDYRNSIQYKQKLEQSLYNHMQTKNTTLELLASAISWRCEELISWCKILENPTLTGEECCNKFFDKTGIWTSRGMCFRATPDDTENQKHPGISNGLQVAVRIFHHEVPDFNYEIVDQLSLETEGLQVSIQCNVTSPSVFKNIMPVEGKKMISASLTYEVVNNRKATVGLWPWSTPTCKPHTLPQNNLTDILDNCYVHSMEICLRRTLNCKYFYSKISAPPDMNICNASSMVEAALNEKTSNSTTNCLTQEAKKCSTICQQDKYVFRTSVINANDTLMKLTETNVYIGKEAELARTTNSNKNAYDLTVISTYFPDLTYTELIRSRKGLLSWMSGVGGQLGLFFGGSTITIFEFILFTLHLLKRLLKNCGKRYDIFCCKRQLPAPDDVM